MAMNVKTNKIILPISISIITLALLGGIFYFASKAPWIKAPESSTSEEIEDSNVRGFDYSWTTNPYIAHAFGGILGDTYTNSYEAFLLNYQLGHRVFEVDFFITNDGKTVLAHDDGHWQTNATLQADGYVPIDTSKPSEFTYDNFMSSLWYGKYHPVNLEELFKLMQNYPDIYIVTDTKYTDKQHVQDQFSAFLESAKNIDSTLLDRFIVQIYHPQMLDWVMEVYPWRSIIYTLYANPNWTTENVIEFSQSSGVKFITIPSTSLTPDNISSWAAQGIKIAVHTINNYAEAQRFHGLGVSNIYTDFLIP